MTYKFFETFDENDDMVQHMNKNILLKDFNFCLKVKLEDFKRLIYL